MSENRIAVAYQDDTVIEPDAGGAFPLLIGHSPLFCRLRDEITRLSALDVPVLVAGEAGAGRSLVARAVHAASLRRLGPCRVVSCHDVPETLLEIELFGCAKGSVVGATSDRAGALDLAHGGTVVIEDIDQMSPRTQRLLTRFLQSGEFHGIGAFGPSGTADVRVIATTRVELAAEVASGRLLADLWTRFAGHALAVPALRDRQDDVPVLADYFAWARRGQLGLPGVAFSAAALRAMMDFAWPGNVRELRAVVDRLASVVGGDEIGADALPVGIRPRRLPPARSAETAKAKRSVGDELFVRLVANGESFWSCVYPLFMQREITRADVRTLVRRGMDVARGNAATLVRLFNMPATDQKRFDSFLRKYDCHLNP